MSNVGNINILYLKNYIKYLKNLQSFLIETDDIKLYEQVSLNLEVVLSAEQLINNCIHQLDVITENNSITFEDIDFINKQILVFNKNFRVVHSLETLANTDITLESAINNPNLTDFETVTIYEEYKENKKNFLDYTEKLLNLYKTLIITMLNK